MVTMTLYVRQQKTQMYRTVFWTLWERARVGWFERMAFKRILSYVKWIACLGSMHDAGCLGLMHWEDQEGWDGEEGGRGFRLGNTGTPVADPCQCMGKPIQYCKVISLQKIN